MVFPVKGVVGVDAVAGAGYYEGDFEVLVNALQNIQSGAHDWTKIVYVYAVF
jgi:hypothetical protein